MRKLITKLRMPLVGSLLVTSLLASCVNVTRSELVAVDESAECVVLLHGLNRSWRAMNKMAKALQAEGYTTVNVDYPSQQGTVEALAPMVIARGLKDCRSAGADKIDFVTHSLGGILLRFAQQEDPIPELRRVVMLGPPNQGSEVIDRTRDWAIAKMFSGEAGMQLGTDDGDIPARLPPVDFDLGVIAGTGTINPFMSAILPDADDGKVTVERTKVEGMDDFLVVRNSHFSLMKSKTVIENTISFLQTGHFLAVDSLP